MHLCWPTYCSEAVAGPAAVCFCALMPSMCICTACLGTQPSKRTARDRVADSGASNQAGRRALLQWCVSRFCSVDVLVLWRFCGAVFCSIPCSAELDWHRKCVVQSFDCCLVGASRSDRASSSSIGGVAAFAASCSAGRSANIIRGTGKWRGGVGCMAVPAACLL